MRIRKAARTLIGIFLFLLAVLAGLLAVPAFFGPFTIDLSERREVLQSLMRDRAGWEIEIEQGPVIELSRRIAVAARGVRLDNPEWKGQQQLVKAGEVRVAFDLVPLLLGKLESVSASLVGAQVEVDKDSSGRVNWRPVAAAEPKEARRGRWSVPERLDLRVESSVVS